MSNGLATMSSHAETSSLCDDIVMISLLYLHAQTG